MGRPTQRDSVNTSRRDGVSDHDLAGVEESLAADEFASEGLMSQHSGDGWPAGSCSDEELEEAWLDDMGGRITAPYRDDRELLRDCVALTDLRQQLYTRRVRAREWQEEGFVERDHEYESAEEIEIRRLQLRADRLAERVERKRELAAKQGIRFHLDAFAESYSLSSLELSILLQLLVEDLSLIHI